MGEGDTVSTSKENLIFIVLEFELKAIILIHVVIYLDKTKTPFLALLLKKPGNNTQSLLPRELSINFFNGN